MPKTDDMVRELRAEIRRLAEALRRARSRLRELNDDSLSTLEDFELPLPLGLGLEEIQRRLSPQEQRVLRAYLEYPNDKAVARHTGKKLQTVRNQMASIEHKLEARGRGELIVKVLVAYFEEKLCDG